MRDISGSPQTPPPDICPDCIENRAGEVEDLIAHWNAAIEPIILHGYSYPLIPLADVIALEALQGRTVTRVIQHAGGWAVTGDLLDNEPEPCYNEYVGVAPDLGAAKAT